MLSLTHPAAVSKASVTKKLLFRCVCIPPCFFSLFIKTNNFCDVISFFFFDLIRGTCLGVFIRFTVHVFRENLLICVCAALPFVFVFG